MGRIKKIVDAIQNSSSGVQGKLQLARVGLKTGMNLSLVNDNTPDNTELEKKLIKAAKEVLGIDISLLSDPVTQEK